MTGRPGAGRGTKWHLSTTTANTESQYSSRHTATSVGNRKVVTRQGRRDREKGKESGNHTIPCVRLWVWWWWLWTLWREGAGRARFLLPLLFTHFLHSVGLVRHTHTFAPNSLFTLCHAALPKNIPKSTFFMQWSAFVSDCFSSSPAFKSEKIPRTTTIS